MYFLMRVFYNEVKKIRRSCKQEHGFKLSMFSHQIVVVSVSEIYLFNGYFKIILILLF